MSADISDYADTIEALRHQHAKPDLAKIIASRLPLATKSVHFLVKMEIKRLAQPISRIIDLRQSVRIECDSYQHGATTHYLDAIGIEDFERELARYDGTYCLGVYEYVVSRASTRNDGDYEKQIAERLPLPKLVSLDDVHQRRDERMYFASQVDLFDEDPSATPKQKLEELATSAMTTDISEHGLTIKVKTEDYLSGDIKYIRFTALEQEFVLSSALFARYKRVKSESQGEYLYITFLLDLEQDAKALNICQGLIKTCIANNKRRNRVDVENTVTAVVAKIHEQYVMGRLVDLPVFLAEKKLGWMPVCVLKSAVNHQILNFLQHPDAGQMLTSLMLNKQLQSAFSEPRLQSLTYFVLRYKDKQQRVNFVAVDYHKALQDPALTALLTRAKARDRVRLLRFHLTGVDSSKDGHLPSSLPDSAGEVFANLNRQPSDKLLATITPLRRMCVISDLSYLMDGLTEFHGAGSAKGQLNIREYLLPLPKRPQPLHLSELETRSLRREERFNLELRLRVRKKTAAPDQVFAGRTVNVSTKGLLVKVGADCTLKNGDDLVLDIELPFSGENKMLTAQPYRIVGQSDAGLHLTIQGDPKFHEGRAKLRGLIFGNLGKVSVADNNDPVYGFSRAVRHVYSRNQMTMTALTFKKDRQHYVCSIIKSRQTPALVMTQGMSEEQSLDALFKQVTLRKYILQKIVELGAERYEFAFNVFLQARKKRDSGDYALVVKVHETGDEAPSLNELASNMRSLAGGSDVMMLGVKVLRKGPLYDRYIKDELRYLQRYAKGRVDTCTDLINHVTALIQIQDLTDIMPR